ncbi:MULTISPECIES: hypothetical protein [unclassified Modestobacter]|uniref:hypothetical protein n=1 Tax=unclassified Modestobacter TaxID=2643866 RepID=UPI0022AB3BFA|nr:MULTISPECIES: hypothetical protein [unclassified Modestobacter]MCZ2825092.1 hypothetical protein [Modestobacter sp. VKM Ac-2981]MCZ2853843.1 hypothetical protein [Modestobacter sp. VKM Ac-2982]
MELSALASGPADGVELSVDLRVGPSGADDLRPCDAVDGSFGEPAAGAAWSETVVVHVQLRPRRPATRRCLAALAALAARHESVAFALTGLSGDDRAVRITVGVELGPRELIAKFSDQAQAAYAFVDGLFTDLYDFMPVYVAEPNEVERAAAAGVLEAVETPRPRMPAPRVPAPRIPSPRRPSGDSVHAPVRRGVPALV